MTHTTPTTGQTNQPSIAHLTAKLLANFPQNAASESEVEPYEVVSGFRADPTSTWRDAATVLTVSTERSKLPAQPGFWLNLIRTLPAQTSLPFALGMFPQLASDLSSMLKLEPTAPEASHGSAPSSIREFLARCDRSKEPLDGLLAAAIARWMGDYAQAEMLLERLPADQAGLENLRTNELATTWWMSGQRERAIQAWEKMPDSVMVDFNLGMAYLFTGQKIAALERLNRAACSLPETSGWQQLAQLYSALAKMA